MTGPIHPKAGGAGLGAALGTLIVGILTAAGVHVGADLATAIGGICAALLAWLAPATEPPPSAGVGPQAPAPEPTRPDSNVVAINRGPVDK